MRRCWLNGFWSIMVAVVAWLGATEHARGLDKDDRFAYLDALRKTGYADMAFEYLQLWLAEPNLSIDDKADLEYERAASLASLAEQLGDMSVKEAKLQEAYEALERFSKDHPNHPRRAEALAQKALIDLQRGQLTVALAQLPANVAQAEELAKKARTYFQKSLDAYEESSKQLQEAFKKFPAFLTEKQREERRRKQQISDLMIESRFQATLTRFYIADTYDSIEPPPPADTKNNEQKKKYEELKKELRDRYKENLQLALKQFDELHVSHRQEFVGLYSHLWQARCLAALGKERESRGIFEQLLEHENIQLEAFQRGVFYFQLLAMLGRKEYGQIISQGTAWLTQNQLRHNRENAYRGVIMTVAQALISRATASSEEKSRKRDFVEADRLLERLLSPANLFSGRAATMRLRIAKEAGTTGSEKLVKRFSQVQAAASAKLDESMREGLSPEDKKRLQQESERGFLEAITIADKDDPINDARISLLYLWIQQEKLYDAAILAEFVARNFPKIANAPDAAYLGVAAYAQAYDKALRTQDQSHAKTYPEEDANHLIALASYLTQKWPQSAPADRTHMIVGRLELARQNYANAAAAFLAVRDQFEQYPEAMAYAGQALWLEYALTATVDADEAKPDPKKLAAMRAKAQEQLQKASELLRKSRPSPTDELVFATESLLAQAYYDANKDEEAINTLNRLVKAVKEGKAKDIPAPQRTNMLLTALQANIRKAQLDKTQELVDLISKQQGSENSGNITLVFVVLAERIKEQIARLKAAGNEAQRTAMVEAFEKFLDQIAARDAGQTIQSLVILARNYIELEKFAKAKEMLKRVLANPDINKTENDNQKVAAQMQLARCYRLTEDYPQAKKLIEEVFQKYYNSMDVVMERGEILNAQGDSPEQLRDAIAHWKWVIKKTKPNRSLQFYEAVHHLMRVSARCKGQERLKRLGEAYSASRVLLQTDSRMPIEHRRTLENDVTQYAKELGDKYTATTTSDPEPAEEDVAPVAAKPAPPAKKATAKKSAPPAPGTSPWLFAIPVVGLLAVAGILIWKNRPSSPSPTIPSKT